MQRIFVSKIKQVSTESMEIVIRIFTQGYDKVRIAEILDCTPKTIHGIFENCQETGQKRRKSELGKNYYTENYAHWLDSIWNFLGKI